MKPNIDFETQLLAAFAAAVLVVAALAVVTWEMSQVARQAALRVEQTIQVLDGLADAKAGSLQIELSTQSYRISGDAERLAERDVAILAREMSLRRIKELTADNASQQERWMRLRQTAEERLAISRRVELLRKTEGPMAASAYAASAPLGETRERLFRILREMDEEERRLLAERSAEQSRVRELRNAIGALAVLALAALLSATYFLIRRQMRATEASRDALKLANARVESIFDSVGEGLHGIDLDGKIIFENPAAVAMLGWDLHELIGRPAHLLMHHTRADGTPYPQDECPIYATHRDGAPRRVEDEVFWRKDGSSFPVAYTSTPMRNGAGEIIGTVVAFRDISERKRAERTIREQNELLEQRVRERTAQLQESEAQLQAVFENLAEGVAVSDLDGQLLHFNRAAIEMFGFASRDEYLRRLPEFADTLELSARDGTILPVEHWPLARILRGETLRDLEMGTRRVRDGDRRIFSYGGTLARDAAGQPLLAVVTIRDITERKQAEQKIGAQLEHLSLLDQITRSTGERLDLKSIFQIVLIRLEDSLPVDFGCVCLHDPVANALRVSCVGAKSAAIARELALDERATIDIDENGLSRCIQEHLVYEPDLGQVRFPFPKRLARGGMGSLVMAPLRSESRVFGVLVVARRAANAFSSAECEFLRQLSEHVALAAHQAQLYGALQQAYDDLRQTQAAAMQEERLRALGQMASGIAHDINNALSPVSLYVESMLDTERALSDRARGYLETIQRAVEDVAQTVARMREFYRKREAQLELTPVQLNSLVPQVLDLTRARWNDMPQQHGIVIRALVELAPDLPQVMGVESEIREALTNLVFNAVDAMPEGGTLTLRTRLADTDPQHPAVAVEVTDTGAGMDEETRRRCLEPFFTTKGERGTGLGLAMVFGMVQRHSAEVAIDSAPGAGTTVRLVFAVPSEVQVETGAPAAALQVPSRLRLRLRLLLIDDDPMLLKALQDTLQTDGHVIATANGGEAGIAAFRTALGRGDTFAAVITDLGMPYVDGRRVASAVKEASPATPVILLTGWGQRLVADNDIPPHVDRVLAKPPKLRELREALAQLCRPQAPEATT